MQASPHTVEANHFAVLGFGLLGSHVEHRNVADLTGYANRHYYSVFGTSHEVIHLVWNELAACGVLTKYTKPKHLLWVCAFLKTYGTENAMSVMLRCSDSSYRRWVWAMLGMIFRIRSKVICWENRKQGTTANTRGFVTVDGTDFRIKEPKPFNPKWYSFKFKSAGVRYEVAVSLAKGDIVWANGPYPCGLFNDLQIYRFGLKRVMEEDEFVVADRGYQADDQVLGPTTLTDGICRARHETVNKRFKNWNCMRQPWRHDRDKHFLAFNAVLVFTQVELRTGFPLFDLNDALANSIQRRIAAYETGRHFGWQILHPPPNTATNY